MIGQIVVVDTETTGLWQEKFPTTDPGQPYLLQIAAKSYGPNREVFSSFSRIIRPEGWTIEPEAEAVHGISEAYAHRYGVPLWIAMVELRASIEGASVIVGHNFNLFDRLVIEASIARTKSDDRWWRQKVGCIYDTQEHATPVLKLPGQWGDYKWPKLEEAVKHFANGLEPWASWTPTHRANDDIEATAFVYWSLQDD